MPTYSVCLTVKLDASSEKEARERARQFSQHLSREFGGALLMHAVEPHGPGTAALPTSVLRALIQGAHTGSMLLKSGIDKLEQACPKNESGRAAYQDIKRWRKAILEAAEIERSATPGKRRRCLAEGAFDWDPLPL